MSTQVESGREAVELGAVVKAKPSWRKRIVTLWVVVLVLVGLPVTMQRVTAESAQAPPGASSLAAARLAAGASHTCALQKNGDVRCWGRSNRGQLGYGNTFSIGITQTPGSQPALRLGGKATALAAGAFHSCALLEGGAVRCWGRNDSGQLGVGTVDDIGNDETPDMAAPVILEAPAIAITAGTSHNCAILTGGAVRCWGGNGAGQLGLTTTANVGDDEAPSSVPTVALGRPAVAIAAGASHTCAILNDGSLRCWGYNNFGQLGSGVPAPAPGSGTTTTTIRPNCIPQFEDCGALSDKDRDQPTTTTAANGGVTPPAAIDLGAGRTAVAVSAATTHTCAILDDGTLRCWGSNRTGQLGLNFFGNGLLGDDETPATVRPIEFGGRKVRDVATGYAHTCAILDDASVRCWGSNDTGQLGLGNNATIGDNEQITAVDPVSLGVGRTALAMVAGGYSGEFAGSGGPFYVGHTCVLVSGDTFVCWGSNGNGQAGYPNSQSIFGDDELPASLPFVDLGDLPVATSTTTTALSTTTTASTSTTAPSSTTTVSTATGRYTGATPARVFDSRLGLGQGGSPLRIGPGQTVVMTAAPAGVEAVALNVTAVSPTASTWLTIWPAGGALPSTSNLNAEPGAVVSNLVIAKVDAAGRVAIRNANGTTDLVVDRLGTFSGSGGRFHSATPSRLLDTRSGIGAPAAPVQAGGVLTVSLTGGLVPSATSRSVVLNVTAVSPSSAGWLTVWPAGEAAPATSNLNFAAGATTANLVVAKLGANGAVSLRNQGGATHVLADVLGWFDDGIGATSTGEYVAVAPLRLLDSRFEVPGTTWQQTTLAGLGGPYNVLTVPVAGRAGVPVGTDAVVVNVMAVSAVQAGYLSVGASAAVPPATSNLNFGAGQSVPNLVTAKLAADGTFTVLSPGPFTNIAVDIQGYFKA